LFLLATGDRILVAGFTRFIQLSDCEALQIVSGQLQEAFYQNK